MSDVIDRSIVEMQFDNRQFESGIAQSLNSIQKLKDSLNFSKSLDAFETISRSIKSVSFDPMVTIWQTTLARITNMAISAGQRITRALTIEPVFTGFQEYTTQIDAIQTILANTEKYGTTLNDVNKALDELNLYADKTIYNFTQMTSNIGRFTAAGVQLDPAVKSIEGMSNLAASSGATAEQASRAYYQMSQALAGMGLRLMDYNSLVNAGMGGQLFQEALKQTARDVKTTTEEYKKLAASGMSVEDISKKLGVSLDTVHKILSENYNKDVDEAIKKQGSFRESLSQGWATADILQRTFAKFSSTGMVEYLHMVTGASTLALEELQKIGQQTSFDSKEFNEYAKSIENVTEAQLEEIKTNLKQAQTAEDAATKVKTFSQLKDTIKEAVQSGWTQTWEYIIGDFEQAKEFFTRISDYLGNIIGKYSDFRNKIVGDWSRGGGRDAVINGLWNIVKIFESFIKPLKGAWENVFPNVNVAATLVNISKAFETLTERLIPHEKIVSRVQIIYEKIFNVFEVLRQSIGNLIHLFPQLEKSLSGSLFSGIFNLFEDRSDAKYRGTFIKYFQDLYDVISDISDKEIKIPGMEEEGKTKLADYKPYQKLLKSITDFWSGAQGTDFPYLKSATDIRDLNDALIKMAFGIEDGNKIISKFSESKRDDYLKYLQEEFGLELETAEDIYRLVDKLNGVETDIFRLIELAPMTDFLRSYRPKDFTEVLATAIGGMFGIDPGKVLSDWYELQSKLNKGLYELSLIFSDTIKALKEIDKLLGALVYLTVVELSERVIKPIYTFTMQYLAPALIRIGEAIKYYALPALNNIIAGLLILLKLGLERIFDNLESWVDKAMPKIEAFGFVLALIGKIISNKFYEAMQKLASLDPATMFWDLGTAIKNWFLNIDAGFKKWAGFSLVDAFNGIIGDIRWVWNKIDSAFKITDRVKSLGGRINLLIKLWKTLVMNGVDDISQYWSAFERVFGFIEDSKLFKIFKRIGLILNGAYMVISTASEQFKILVDNPSGKSLPERLTTFFNRIYDSFVSALRLNGVSDKVIKVFDVIFYVFRSFIQPLADLFVKLRDKLDYSTVGIRAYFEMFADTLSEFVSKHKLVVESIGTAVAILAFVTIAIAVIAAIINTGYTLGEGLMAIVKFITPKNWGYVKSQLVQTLNDISDMTDDISRAFKIAQVVAIAASITMLAGALYMLTTLNYEDVIRSLGVLLIIMGSLWLLTVGIAKLTGSAELTALSASFLSIAAVMAAMAIAVLAINAVWESGGSAGKAIGMVIGLMSALGGILVVLSFIGKIFGGKGLASMVLAGETISVMAKTMINMAPAIYLVSKLDGDAYKRAIGAMIVLFVGMAVYSLAASKVDTANMMGAAILTFNLAVAMAVLVGALKLFTVLLDDTDIPEMVASLIFIVGILVLLGAILAISAFGDWKSFLTGVAVILSIATTIVLISGAMSIMAAVSQKCLVGLIAATAALVILIGAISAFVGLFVVLGALAESGVGAVPLLAVIVGMVILGVTALEMGASLLISSIAAIKFAEAFERVWAVVKDIFSPLMNLLTQYAGVAQETVNSGVNTVQEFWELDLASKISVVLGKILSALHKFVDGLIKVLDTILPLFKKIAEELLPRIDDFLHIISDALATYVPKLIEYISTVLTAVINAINEFGPPLLEAVTALIKWVLDLLIPWLEANLPGWLAKLTPVADAIIKFVINTIANLLVALYNRAEDIATSILGIISKVLEALTEVVDENTGKMRFQLILDKLYDIIRSAIVDYVPKLAELALLLITTLSSTIVAVVMALVFILDSIVEDIVDHLAEQFPKHINHISDAIEKNKENTISAMERLCTVVSEFLIDAISRVLFKSDSPLIKKIVGGFLATGFMVVPAFILGVATKIAMLKELAKGTFEIFMNSVRLKLGLNKDGSAKKGTGVHKIGYSILSSIKGGIVAAWGLLFGEDGKVNKLGETILGSIQGVLSYSTFKTIGEDIINGLIDGIKNPEILGKLEGTIGAVFGKDGVLDWIKKALDESSPSKATAAMGVFVDQGLEDGLIKGLPGMMNTVDEVFGEGTGVMEGIRDALGVHSHSWKTKEYGEDTDGGLEDGVEAGEPSMLDKIKETFGSVITTIKDTLTSSEEGSNPISSLLNGLIDGWDPDKSLTENLKDKFDGLLNGDNGLFGKNGLFGGLLEGLTGEDGPFGENGIFGGIKNAFEGIFQNEDGKSIFDGLFEDVGDIKWVADTDYNSLSNVGETLSDGKLNTSSANTRTITSNGTYANAMNDMVNSGQYWNDPNALTNADIVNAIATVVQRLDNIDENMPKEVVLDTGAMVGNLSPEMNKALGRMLRQKGRRV